MNKELKNMKIKKILEKYPYAKTFLEDQQLSIDDQELTISQLYQQLTLEQKEDLGLDIKQLEASLDNYIEQMQEFIGESDDNNTVQSLTILAGKDKDEQAEKFAELKVHAGEIISIVGPTGSGKSRLLADIEWTAQADTPTERSILINGQKPDLSWRFSGGKKLVAQLSQNMNFVMDLGVEEFIRLHAASRLVKNEDEIVARVITEANFLAGEKFSADTQITSLSGGQSRALMIADTAILSRSPIILIDEIENAGIDREKALDLLVGENKIVLMATHDPILALMGDKRIVINNGGIEKIIKTKDFEKELLIKLKKVDNMLSDLRNSLRYGKELTDNPNLTS